MRNRKEADHNYHQSLKGKFTHYKKSARGHKRTFDLTFDEFSAFWNQPCTYCGAKIETIGLDRIDSLIGYTLSNVTSCCYHCNTMKNSHSVQAFIEHCKKIIKVFEEDEVRKMLLRISK